MTDAKSYLQQIGLLDKRINAKLEEIQALKDMVTRITPALRQDAGTGGGSGDKLGDAVARIVDLQREVNADVERYADAWHRTARILRHVNDRKQYEVLHSHYVLMKSFEQIACEMHMTYRNICYIHGAGLLVVENLLFEKEI